MQLSSIGIFLCAKPRDESSVAPSVGPAVALPVTSPVAPPVVPRADGERSSAAEQTLRIAEMRSE